MLKGRLGLETARVPHVDRHGLLWLSRGALAVREGTLFFTTAGGGDLGIGTYDIPFQLVSAILLEPGTTVSHDALRLLARHGTGLLAVGTGGVRLYASMPFGPDQSALARRHVTLWADEARRLEVARKMYAIRLGEIMAGDRIEQLRGMEGIRARETYRLLADRHGVPWEGRRYDRGDPGATDPVNMAINHASVAVVASAQVATAVAGAVPQLGFIHEDSGISFPLDVADLYRDTVTLPAAFEGYKRWSQDGGELEGHVRKLTGSALKTGKVVASMIDRIKEIVADDDAGGHP